MDSITQIALGATVAEVAVGRKAGNKAILWGSVFGTLPDLDVVLHIAFDEVAMLGIHRGFSHSIFFAALTAPLFGMMLRKIHSGTEISAIKWAWMVFFVLFTHVMLDSFTVYGTQLFAPISNYPVGFNSIFIIDPIYTLPLLLGVIATLFIKNRQKRYSLNKFTLIFSAAYLLLSVILKIYTLGIFKENLEKENIKYEKMITMPAPLNIFMFNSIALQEDTLYVSTYSIFDDSKELDFIKIGRNSELIEMQKDTRAIKRLLWFSRGYYHIWENEGELYFSDLRFGRSDFWMGYGGNFIFNYKLILEEEGEITGFERGTPSFERKDRLLNEYFQAVFGRNNK